MRKVVTGEQVAQLYNRDPFACPVWRSPVYRTPAGFILLVQLVRLLGWLVRLVARHPAAAAVLAAAGLTWLNLGWLGLVAAGGVGRRWSWLTWRYFWPGSFARWVSGPGPGQVAGLVLPAPVGRR